jgi:DNA-binding SARP family transcriptional activator
MPRACAVRLLGSFRVEVDGHTISAEAWRHRRGADLVKRLALAPKHRLHREELMEDLWPDLGAEAAAANLRKAVHYARHSLGGKDAVSADGEILVLWPAGELTVDAQEAEDAAASALASGRGLERVVDLFTGDLLPDDRYAEWTVAPRDRLRARRLEVLRAARRWGQVLDLDPSDEEACRALMQIHLTAGNRPAAIRQFQRLREILRIDLGLAPEPATVALFEQAVGEAGSQPSSPTERAQARLARGLLHWHQRELDAAQLVAEEVRSLATENHLGRELGEASALLGMVAMARGRWPDRFRADFADALRMAIDQAPFVLDAHLCMAEASLASAHSQGVAALAYELLPLAIEAGSAPGEALMSLMIGESQLLSGHLDEAYEWLSRASGLYQELDWDSGRALALVRLAETARAGPRRAEAAGHLTQALPLSERSDLASHLVVKVFAAMIESADRTDQRQRVLGDAERVLQSKEVCGPCSIGFRAAAATAYARSGELSRARVWLGDAERLAGMWQGSAWQATVWEARATLRHAEGDSGRAAALMREAAGLFAECGRPLDEARCVAAARG